LTRPVADIPEAVDLAVITVPAAGIINLMPQLKAKGDKKHGPGHIRFR
jgi:acyl-CoA synthetase (NDP forming)